MIQGIGSTDNVDYKVSLLDVLHTTENDPPINQECHYEVILLTVTAELIRCSYYGITNEGSSFISMI
jgi:hypothetical protein